VKIDRTAVDALLQFSTPSLMNGLKRLGRHPSEMESLDRFALRCISPALGRRVGFAATRKVATSTDGSTRSASSPSRRADEHILTVSEPRILVAENVGEWKGRVCIWGEVAANLYTAMGCTGGITNGPVRDIDEMERVGFQTFASGPGVGGGFVDVLEAGEPVEIGGVTILPGDLLHADRHGVVKVPIELAAALPDAIRAVEEMERRVIDVCRSPGFSLDAFTAAWASEGKAVR
jgi:regulator of RNase E activity RraA